VLELVEVRNHRLRAAFPIKTFGITTPGRRAEDARAALGRSRKRGASRRLRLRPRAAHLHLKAEPATEDSRLWPVRPVRAASVRLLLWSTRQLAHDPLAMGVH
jgi:hypothetical protein